VTRIISVLLAEDHETVREGLRLLVNGQTDMTVVAEAADGQAAIERARVVKPAAVVLDLNMPNMNGLAAARVLREAVPASAVIVLTRHNDKAYLHEMLEAGASAYVLKQSPSTELLTAIRTAVAGRQYVDPALRDDFDLLAATGRRVGSVTITERECEVLRLMALGQSNKEIAARLNISVKTVEVHKSNAMRKLSLKGRTDVIKYAALHGWLDDL
jgi:two-component system, NarL family, response regulator NreC